MNFDARRMKRLERDGYNLIGRRYAAAAGPRADLLRAVLDAARLGPGQRVLDVAAGPGLLASAALDRAPDAWIVATDLAEAQLACCPGLPRAAADAERLPFADGSFDRALCGLGLMFFPDPEKAVAEIRRVLAPGGLLALSVWGIRERTPLVACALDCLARVLPPPKVARPSIFRFGEAAALARALAGFAPPEVRPVPLVVEFPDAAAYWQAFLDLAGGATGSLARLPADRQNALAAEVARELAPFATPAGYRLQSEVLVAVAVRQ
ncbi:MAG: methyltransferase domain-containing protein [Rhodocyclaceae bacterium]|nr:methyltransferase domain-containing protein [Rhodocyclaceae bacterium]